MRLFSDDSSSIADPYLRRAWELALRGLGSTSPNPAVGCVVVAQDRIVGEGWHEKAGGPHAEIVALRAAGTAARGSAVYVTLEPCAHHGRTPPCVDALVAADVARVIIGMPDPSDLARGGADALRSAGIEVAFAEEPGPFESLNEGWLSLVRRGWPWVTAKVACTLDARVSEAPGLRSRVSGEDSARITMTLRARSDAIVVGARTALTDDPALTVRDATGRLAARQPLRVVFARTTDPMSASLFGDGAGPSALLVPSGAAVGDRLPAGVERISYPGSAGVAGALEALGSRGYASVLVEPGPGLFAALWAEDVIDELVLIHAGRVFGEGGTPLYSGLAGTHIHTRMQAIEAGVVGGDAVTVWRRETPVRAHGAVRKEG